MEVARLDVSDESTALEILELQRRSYRVEAELIGSHAIPPLRETLAELRDCGESFLGVRIDGVLAGAISWRVEGDTIDLHRLVVDPIHFRQGIGSCLLRAALAAESDVRRALVQTGASNTPAEALYRREGFARIGETEPLPGLRVARFAKELR